MTKLKCPYCRRFTIDTNNFTIDGDYIICPHCGTRTNMSKFGFKRIWERIGNDYEHSLVRISKKLKKVI